MRVLTGRVVSTKMSKTAIVEVVKTRRHPLYKKIIKRSKRYKVHYEEDNLKEGDMVKIVETHPISKEKHFKLFK